MVNQGTILGRIGRIETKSMSSGMKVTNLSMVTSKKYVKDGEKQEKVTWHNVTLYNKLAEIAEKYVAIGDLLYVQGEMDSKKYLTPAGQEKVKFFLLGHELKLMPRAKEHTAVPKEHYDMGLDEDTPF